MRIVPLEPTMVVDEAAVAVDVATLTDTAAMLEGKQYCCKAFEIILIISATPRSKPLTDGVQPREELSLLMSKLARPLPSLSKRKH